MDYFNKLNSKNKFGVFGINNNKKLPWVNIICAILLVGLIITLIVCLATKKDGFSSDKLEHCDVLMFDRDGCGFSAKMKKLIEDNNYKIGDKSVCIVDITKEPEIAKKYNANGTPYFALKNNPDVFSSGFAPIEQHDSKLLLITLAHFNN